MHGSMRGGWRGISPDQPPTLPAVSSPAGAFRGCGRLLATSRPQRAPGLQTVEDCVAAHRFVEVNDIFDIEGEPFRFPGGWRSKIARDLKDAVVLERNARVSRRMRDQVHRDACPPSAEERRKPAATAAPELKRQELRRRERSC